MIAKVKFTSPAENVGHPAGDCIPSANQMLLFTLKLLKPLDREAVFISHINIVNTNGIVCAPGPIKQALLH